MSISYSARQLIVFKWYMTLSNGTQQLVTKYFSTDETVYNGIYYEPRIIDEIEISQSIPEQYNGFANFDTFTISLSNADGHFYFKDEGYTLYWKPDFRGAEVEVYWQQDNNTPQKIAFGTVISHVVGDVVRLECIQMDYRPFQLEVPKCKLDKTYIDDNGNSHIWEDRIKEINPNFNLALQYIPERDLGKCIPLTFGYSRKIPARYIWADHTNNKYIYAFSCRPYTLDQQGNMASIQVSMIYRGDVPITADKFASNNVSVIIDSSPYARRVSGTQPPSIHYLPTHHPLAYQKASLCYLVFDKEQRDFSGNLYEISVTAGWHRLDTFETAIWDMMTDSVLGLNMMMSPVPRPALPSNLQDVLACDGHISEPIKLQTLLEDWLWHYGGYIERVCSMQYKLHKDKYGGNDNAVIFEWTSDEVIEVTERKRLSFESIPKKINLEYRKAGDKYPYKLSRDLYPDSGGEELLKQSNFTRKIKDADRILCYRQRRYLGCDEIYNLTIGYYGLSAKLGDIVRLDFKRGGLEIDRIGKISRISRDIAQATITVEPHSAWIYEYDYANWKDDMPEFDPYAEDSESPPPPPTNLIEYETELYTDMNGNDRLSKTFRCYAPMINGRVPQSFSKIFFQFRMGIVGLSRPASLDHTEAGFGEKIYAKKILTETLADGSKRETWECIYDRFNINPNPQNNPQMGKIYYDVKCFSESKIGIDSDTCISTSFEPPYDTLPPQEPMGGWQPQASFNATNRMLSISWQKSPSSDVDMYEIWTSEHVLIEERWHDLLQWNCVYATKANSARESIAQALAGRWSIQIRAVDKSGNRTPLRSAIGWVIVVEIPPVTITKDNLPSTYLDISSTAGIAPTPTDGYRTTVGVSQSNSPSGMLHIYKNNQIIVKAGQVAVAGQTASLYAVMGQGNSVAAYFDGNTITSGDAHVGGFVLQGKIFKGWEIYEKNGQTYYVPLFQ